jgi:hypothetical protein
MTAARRPGKFCSSKCSSLSRRRFLAAVVLLAAVPAAISNSRATTTEQVVTDRNTGLAISGFDPLAYFIDGAALQGSDDFEHAYAGAVWRFRNEGNRAAFIADPEVYMPRFGGYDPVGVARGVAVPGDPRLWLMAGERLYLFYTPEDRTAFIADVDALVALADSKWPQVQLTLTP